MAHGDLHRLIGIREDTPVAELRHAYERAMREATRSGDHKRAMALSAAFDALPPTTKSQLYRKSTDSMQVAAPPGSPPIPPSAWAGFVDGPGPRRRPARPKGRAKRRGGWRRVVGYAIGVPAVVAAGVYGSVHYGFPARWGDQRDEPVIVRTHQIAPAPQVQTAPRVAGYGPTMQVPMAAPTGVNGGVTLVCEAAGGRPGYLMTAPRGALVACSNGAVPKVVG